MIKKYTFSFFLLFFVITSSNVNANKVKIDDLEIKLFETDKLVKSSRMLTDGFGQVRFKAFAEKIDDQNFGSIILVVYSKIDKYGPFIRNFFLEYFFKNENAIFRKDDAYHYFANEDLTSAMQVNEINLEKFIKRSDDFFEVRSALKGLYKKSSFKNNDRVIKSDHFYLKSNGNLVWVSYMFNYETAVKENLFQNGNSKFHPKNINEFPRFKKFMDNWSNLAFKRHEEFQEKLKVNSRIDLNIDGFENNENLSYYENLFFSSKFNLIKEGDNEEQRKAKEEKEKKAKLAAEQKAKEEKEKKAKLAAEQKTESEDSLSVEDIMAKIKELNEMYKSGLISKEEFEMLKNKLLKN